MACNLPTLPGVDEPFPTITLMASPIPQTNTPIPTATSTPTPPPAVRIEQADQALASGDYARSILENQTVLSGAKDSETQAAALYGLGRTQYHSGDYLTAIQTFTTITEAYRESRYRAGAFFFLGECYMAINNYNQAAESYNNYLNLGPGVLDAFVLERRGDAFFNAGAYQDAIAAYEAAAKAPQLGDPAFLEIKAGKAYAAMNDHANAIRKFMAIYETSNNDYIKAQMDFLTGQSYLAIGENEQAYARFQDSVNNYPTAYDSYSGLVELINAGQTVDGLNRGLVDYHAGQYAVAIAALDDYITSHPDHDGTPLHYKALSYRALGEQEKAIAAWDELITNYEGDRFWVTAWEEKATTQVFYQDQPEAAAQTLLKFIKESPTSPEAPGILFDAARNLERANQLEQAATTWERLMDEYPSAEISSRGLFLAGVTYFRLKQYNKAQTIFQRALVLGVNPEDQAAAHLWIGKTHLAQNQPEQARLSWEQAAQRDPTGYFSERARQLLAGEAPLTTGPVYQSDYNLDQERHLAEMWIRSTFSIPESVDLSGLGPLGQDPRMQRGDAFWELDLLPQADQEFETVRKEITQDAANCFRFLNHMLQLGFYRQAILTSRQILDLANLDDADTFTAPDFFNHVRFGQYFADLVVPISQAEGIPPLLLFALIRQESLFQPFATSAAGARGLMQLMPATAGEIVTKIGWPPDYKEDDLYRPLVSINLGAHYLARWESYFGSKLYSLAAFNGGPGNVIAWKELAGDDPDLFLEVIRSTETRNYIIQISEFLAIYRRLYEKQ